MSGFRPALLAATLALLSACATAPGPGPVGFEHDLAEGPLPWTAQAFDTADDRFTFALVSDLTGGEREGVFEVAVEQLRLLRPELILTVGDLIEGGTTDRDQLVREWDDFDRRAARARAPLFRAGGNHDLTNPVMWDVFEERYGRRYYHFVYRDTLFLVLDTEDNSPEAQWALHRIRDEAMQRVEAEGWDAFMDTDYGRSPKRRFGHVGEEQSAYFRGVIEAHADVLHTFVVLHKPVWERDGETGFTAIEEALAGRPYTVFYGHEHAYLHELRHGRDYIRLGTTGGVQNPRKDMAIDHVTLVTVSETEVDIANLRLSGIFGKEGTIPLNGEDLCFDVRECGVEQP